MRVIVVCITFCFFTTSCYCADDVPPKPSKLWPYLAYYSARACLAGAQVLCAVMAGRRAARNEFLRTTAQANVLVKKRQQLSDKKFDLEREIQGELVSMQKRAQRVSLDDNGNGIPTQGVWAIQPTRPLESSVAMCCAAGAVLSYNRDIILAQPGKKQKLPTKSAWLLGVGLRVLGEAVNVCGNALWYQFGKERGLGNLCAALACTMLGCAIEECSDCLGEACLGAESGG